jgi:hypothetical protein
MTSSKPDIFTNVHRGIRSALFETCLALGRAGGDLERSSHARKLLAEALHFVAHHGENEDLLLVPLIAGRDASCAARFQAAHGQLEPAITSLQAAVNTAPIDVLRTAAESLTARYLAHMSEEEQELEPIIRAVVPPGELATFSQKSVARTQPEDQRMMLGWMLPAMPREDAMAFLSRLPAEIAEKMRPLVDGRSPSAIRQLFAQQVQFAGTTGA